MPPHGGIFFYLPQTRSDVTNAPYNSLTAQIKFLTAQTLISDAFHGIIIMSKYAYTAAKKDHGQGSFGYANNFMKKISVSLR
jgi:hypothetical protein